MSANASLRERRCLSEIRPVPRRGLSPVESAMYLGISLGTFDKVCEEHDVPFKKIGARKIFDIRVLDELFDALPDENHNAGDDWTVAL